MTSSYRDSARRVAILIAVGVVVCVHNPATAQEDGTELSISLGEPTEHVRAAADGQQEYAIYLPNRYEIRNTHPVLLLMDPRGRAMIPLALFRRAAEDFGYVILSSYGTLSDDPTAFDKNDRAINAMIIDAQARFNVDPSRFYLVGFSGTAHYAWNIAPQLDGSLAGIIGVGGGLPAYSRPIQKTMTMQHPIAFFGIAGIGDFNYDGVRWLDEALDTTRVQHRFVSHDGRHQWPPEEIAYDAVEWMELQAMQTGSVSPPQDLVKDLLGRYMDEARQFEKSGDLVSAYRRYREIAADFADLGGSEEAQRRFEELGRDKDMIDELTRWDELGRRVQLYKISVRAFSREYAQAERLIQHTDALKRLNIPALLDEADDRDYQVSGAARRMLASAFANTSFYEPREYFRQKDYERAAGMLRIAQEIFRDFPRTCYQLAQAEAQLGRFNEATDALACAIEASWTTPESIESDELLEPIRGTTAYQQLLSASN